MVAIFTKFIIFVNKLIKRMFDLLQYICFLNLTTPVEVMAKVYVILDHPSYVIASCHSYRPTPTINTTMEVATEIRDLDRNKNVIDLIQM